MRLSLYSELARQNIVQARKYIKANQIEANQTNIRNFRKNILH